MSRSITFCVATSPSHFLLLFDFAAMDALASLPPVPVAVGGVLAYLLGSCAYNIWFHPLRHIPGPWYASASPLYLISTDLRLKRGTS